MPPFVVHFCTICGREKNKTGWFLLADNRWEDKLRVFQWDARAAETSGVHAVCGAAHARELALHWMRTGILDYPLNEKRSYPNRSHFKINGRIRREPELTGVRLLGELFLHRESVSKLLYENPGSMAQMLGELIATLGIRGELRETADDAKAVYTIQPWGRWTVKGRYLSSLIQTRQS